MFDDDLENLPEDPELQFVAYERRLLQRLWDNLKLEEHEQYSQAYERDQKVHYMTKLMAFHDAHGFNMLEKPSLPRNLQDFDSVFDDFRDQVNYWTTQIQVRHLARLRPISTILTLTPEIRRQLHAYINRIRETLEPIELDTNKKEALYTKLNALAEEIDRDRTKTEAWTAFTLEIASAGGKAAQELIGVRKLSDSIGNLLGKAKQLSDLLLGLPSPGGQKKIEGPPKQLTAPNEFKPAPRPVEDDLDDEIPF